MRVKKFFSILASFMVMVLFVTGCSFIEINPNKYYNQIVASASIRDTSRGIDFKTEITVQDLLDGINSFGWETHFNSPQNPTGNSNEEAIRLTIQDLIDREIILYQSRKMRDQLWRMEEGNEFKFDQARYTYDRKRAAHNAFATINNTIEGIEREILREWKIEWPGTQETNPDLRERTPTYIPFESRVERDQQGRWQFVDHTEHYTKDHDFGMVNAINLNIIDANQLGMNNFPFESLGRPVGNPTATAEEVQVFNEATNRYFRRLRVFYENRGVFNQSNQQLLNREVRRMMQAEHESIYIERLGDWFDFRQINGVAATPGEQAQVLEQTMNQLNRQIAETFQRRYALEVLNFPRDTNGQILDTVIQAYRARLRDNPTAEPTLFHPITGAYFTVQHFLIPFSDAQNALIAERRGMVGDLITQDDLDAFIEQQAALIRSPRRVDGVVPHGATTQSYSAIHAELIGERGTGSIDGVPLDIYGNPIGMVERAAIFRDFMFDFTTDTGTLNAEGDYIIPTARETNGVMWDSMVEEFANESRRLREEDMRNNRVGSISEPILSQFGWHIIMYTGEIENRFDHLRAGVLSVDNPNDVETIANTLFNTLIKVGHNKTYYDLILEDVMFVSFGEYIQNILSGTRTGMTFDVNKNRIRDIERRFFD